MSCSGQSDTSHSTNTPATKAARCLVVTIGVPGGTTLGPITRTEYTPMAMMPAISSHTSGCAWNFQGSGRRAADRREHGAYVPNWNAAT